MTSNELADLLTEIQNESEETELSLPQKYKILETISTELQSKKRKKNKNRQIFYPLEATLIFSGLYSLFSNIRIGLYFNAIFLFIAFMLPAYLLYKVLIRKKNGR